MTRRTRRGLGIAFIAVGIVFAGYGFYIPAKAAVAQVLLARSWIVAKPFEKAPPPWPWADTYPVARLVVPRLDADVIVLAGAHGRSLAFGPGHVEGSAMPGKPGHSVVAAHRDTHFAFLQRIRIGDAVYVEQPGGRMMRHTVVATKVIDTRRGPIDLDETVDVLTMVTCYPFTNWNPGGPLRYVVSAVADPESI